MKKLFAIAILASFTTLAAPLQWTCDWPEAKSQTFSLYQGETATFEPTFRVNGRTVTNATIEAVWYQTNGMGNAWWKLDGATFAPSNDVGAAAYRFFVEASVPGSPFPVPQTIYRANGALRMLPSPGFTPNAIEPPIRTLDFANIEVANDPWTEAIESNRVEIATVRVGVASNSAAIETNSDAIAEIAGTTSALSDSISTLSTNVYTKAETDAAIAAATPAETDPVWEAEKSGYATAAGLAALEAEARPAINGYSR
ncbi:MAG: hypothetical protein II839_10155, partial [Kiritimatiellae bacterium]|nr:hypothetical protein [Kiritimatiellia bacterium]